MSDKVEQFIKHMRKKSRVMHGASDQLLSIVKYWFSTGCWPLDSIIGGGTDAQFGGIPSGRIMEWFGDESTAKSLISLCVIAQFQRMGGHALLCDVEATNTPEFMARLGVDLPNLVIAYPQTIEDVYDATMSFLEAKQNIDEENDENSPAIIVWDSIAATTSVLELERVEEKGFATTTIAPHARAMSKLLRHLPQRLHDSNTAALFVNQTRQNIGVMYGDPVATPGGKALKFACSVRVMLKDVKRYKSSGEVIGHQIRARIQKNKIDIPFGMCEFPVLFDSGFDNEVACFWFLKQRKQFESRGGWNYITLGGEEKKFRTKSWRELFQSHSEEIREIVMSRVHKDEPEEMEDDE